MAEYSDPERSLEQLLSDLTDAKLEKRQADIERLQQEIGRRQKHGEQPPTSSTPESNTRQF